MNAKYNKLVLVMLVLIVSMTSVQASWFGDFFTGGVDTTEYDECLTFFTQEDCEAEFCNGNSGGDKIYCNYDTDTNRLFEAEFYPMTCDALNKWNSTEEIRFAFGVNVDSQDHSLNARICQGDEDFDQFLKKDSYQVPSEVLNSVESYEYLWVDLFGAVYLEKPSKSELDTIYGNVLVEYEGFTDGGELDYLYENLKKEPMNDQIFSVLSCSVDCNYEGSEDNDLDLPVSTNGKKGGVAFDYTKQTTFLDELEAERWAEKQELTMDNACSFWDNLLSNWECANNFIDNVNLQNYYKIIDRIDSDIDYTYWYSNTNNVLNSFTCDYPKDTYANQEVTARVSCNIGKTWEGIFFSPSDELDYSVIGLGSDDTTAYFNMDMVFYLNETSGIINKISQNLTEGTRNLNDFVDQEGDKLDGVLDYLIKYDDGVLEFTEQTIDNRVVLQPEIKNVIDGVLELNTYVFSFILLVAYFIETFIFIGIFRLIIGSFNAIRKAFKDLFGITNGGDE